MLAYIIKASLNNNVNKKPEVNTLINSLIMKLKNKIISYCFLILTSILLCHLDKSQLHKTHFYSEAQKFIPVKETPKKGIHWELVGSWQNEGLYYVTETSFYDNGEKGYTRLEHFNSEGNFEINSIYINNYNFYTPEIEPREVGKQLYYNLKEKDLDLYLDENRRYYSNLEFYSLKKGCSVGDKIWVKINVLLDQDIFRRIDYSQEIGNLIKSNWSVDKLRTQSICLLNRDNIYTKYYNRQIESPNNYNWEKIKLLTRSNSLLMDNIYQNYFNIQIENPNNSNFSKSKLCPSSNNLLCQDNIYQKYYNDPIENSNNSNRSKSKLCTRSNNLFSEDNIYQEYYNDQIWELQNLDRHFKNKIIAYCKHRINTHSLHPDYTSQDNIQQIIRYLIQSKEGLTINNSDIPKPFITCFQKENHSEYNMLKCQPSGTCLNSNYKVWKLNSQTLTNPYSYFQVSLNISHNKLNPCFPLLIDPTCMYEPQAEKDHILKGSLWAKSSIEYQIAKGSVITIA